MKITIQKGSLADAPNAFVKVRLTEEKRGVARFVRDGHSNWLEIGAGKGSEMTPRTYRLLCRSIIVIAKAHQCKKIAIEFGASKEVFKTLRELLSPSEAAAVASESFEMANFEFNHFKTKPKEGWPEVEEVLVFTPTPVVAAASRRGSIIGEEVNAARVLANTPGGDMTPTSLAKAAKDAVKGLPVKVTTLGENELKKQGFGALLGVAKGSSEKPTFTIMEYRGGKGAPIVLAGKGVTFDSGGLNVKSESGMYEMHMDMAGAAAVIHTVALAARLKIKKNVIGLIPAVENMSGGSAYRPGDILKSLSGKTIEVLNTDAEGRLILADALTYAKRFKPAAVIDVATLTGAALVALGQHANALLTRDDTLANDLLASAEESGDYLWRLPMWDEYEDSVKSAFADVANVPGNSGASRYGGAINGGMFLWQFAKELNSPWAHIDIAPRMTPAPGEHLSKGATGTGVRLLLHYIER